MQLSCTRKVSMRSRWGGWREQLQASSSLHDSTANNGFSLKLAKHCEKRVRRKIEMWNFKPITVVGRLLFTWTFYVDAWGSEGHFRARSFFSPQPNTVHVILSCTQSL